MKVKKMKFPKIKRKFYPVIIVSLIIIIILTLIAILFVSKSQSTSPEGLTKKYMENYKKLDKSVTSRITYDFSDKIVASEESTYRSIMKRQYEKMNYFISDSYVGETDAIITVEFTVYDLKSAMDRANSYVDSHNELFNVDGKVDTRKVVEYKLKQLDECRDTVDYSIKFNFYKNDLNKWVMTDLSDSDLQKLDGTF